MVGWQVLSRPSAAEGGGRRPAFTGLATQPYSATEVDGWQHKLSRVSQNRAAVQGARWVMLECRHDQELARDIPDKGFFVIFRLYGPKQAFFDQTWQLPDIENLN